MELLTRKIDHMNNNKLDSETGLAILSSKANYSELKNKVDIELFVAVQEELQAVATEIGGLRALQKHELIQVQKMMEKKLITAMSKFMDTQTKDTTDSFSTIHTKALCLGCGKPTAVRQVPDANSIAHNLPSTLLPSSPGPDILRAGYKMASRPEPPDHGYSSLLDSNLQRLMDDVTVADGDSTSTSNAEGLLLSKSSTHLSLQNSGPKIVRLGGKDDSNVILRPLHRKGFPGKTSKRAETAFAPERFELLRAHPLGEVTFVQPIPKRSEHLKKISSATVSR